MKLAHTPWGLAIQSPGSTDIPLHTILGIGLNYAEHAREQGKAPPTRPVVFAKYPFSAILSGEEIVIPKACQDPAQVDFEGELAVVIGRGPGGRPARDVPLEDARRYVLGYCCANDVSARWWQKDGSGGQFTRGKSFDTFCPLGPSITPAGQVEDPQKLRITTRLNGEVVQDSSTGDMIFPVAQLIHELSRGATLLPGTVLLTGTPSGVGFARKPPIFLKQGDVVEVDISSLGSIRNPVRAE